MTCKNYQNLHEISRQARVLEGIVQHLDWDQETYMPSAATDIRAEQLKTLAGIIHKLRTGPKFKSALSKLIDLKTGKVLEKKLTEPEKAALKAWRHDFLKEDKLPSKFVEDFSQLTSKSMHIWREARKTNTFQHFAPFLDRIITMSRKKADYIGYKEHPYDALLDYYERDTSTKEVSKLFSNLQKALIALLKHIQSKKQVDDRFLSGKFSQEKQLEFGQLLLNAMGYDKTRGRLDLSTHPFSCSTHPTDSRITTRIHPRSVMSNIFTILHEGGHSLYEMGLPIEEYGSPLGDALSLGMHECQSRWWETRIGRSKSFWQHFFPLLQKQFKGKLDKVSLDNFYRAINKVDPSFIRVEADEVTYSLHVILRFEMERQLIEGTLKVREIPEAWNAKMQELLGITPKTNSEGCLQDVHWSMGGFGYFPTYTLGNLYASHLFKAFEKTHAKWEQKVSSGELLFIKDWLSENVYRHGRRYSSKELLKSVTGKEFSEVAYVDYLKNKYHEVY